jgi:hypothetical protein
MPDAVTDLPPELANHPKFRIVRELGRGGMGVIYLAEHRVMDKPVALKVISPAVLDNPTAVARFLAEVRAAGRLDHQNIARAYDADRAGDLHFLVMEYIEGISLAQLLEQRGPLPIPNACHYVRQAALGLHHAFEQDMVHRDVKPQNLMLTPRGLVKVLDFGLARLRGERHESTRLTQMESFMGTPEYVAPEQATDARKADTRSDIYSLGCTLYALLTGRPPFVGDTVVQVVLAHVENQPRPLHERRPDVPRELSAVVAKMLAKDPAKRYQRPIDAAQALAPFVQPFVQPGGQSEASAVPLAIPVTAVTLVDGDTRPEKRRRNDRARPSARKDRDKPTGVPTAWWARPVVIAGAAAAVLALGAVAGAVILVLLLMTDKDARIAVAPPPGPEPVAHQEEPADAPAGPAAPAPDAEPDGGGAGGAAAALPEHQSASNDAGKAPPVGPEKTAEEKKADEDAAREARQREQARKDAEEARKRELAAKRAEADRRRRQAEKAAEQVRQREEARQKAETTAATRLKLAKKLPDAARDAYDHGNPAEEKRLKQQYTEALHDIVKKYPNTKAAKEARELLDK